MELSHDSSMHVTWDDDDQPGPSTRCTSEEQWVPGTAGTCPYVMPVTNWRLQRCVGAYWKLRRGVRPHCVFVYTEGRVRSLSRLSLWMRHQRICGVWRLSSGEWALLSCSQPMQVFLPLNWTYFWLALLNQDYVATYSSLRLMTIQHSFFKNKNYFISYLLKLHKILVPITKLLVLCVFNFRFWLGLKTYYQFNLHF